MRTTCVVRGIKGIFPLIKKECPQAILYPHRFSDLSGYRIAIDATLLVQRYHFTDTEDPHRHLFGFLKLINQLRQHNVYPIFVFDHLTSRVSAKSRETEKRRELRNRLRARADLEQRRAWRLRVLGSALRRIATLSNEDNVQIATLLQQWRKYPTTTKVSPQQAAKVQHHTAPIPTQDLPALPSASWDSDEPIAQLPEEKADLDRVFASAQGEPDDVAQEKLAELAAGEAADGDEGSPAHLEDWQIMREEQTTVPYAIAAQIHSLKEDFELLQAQQAAHRQSSSSSSTYSQTSTQIRMSEIEERMYEKVADINELVALAAEAATESTESTWSAIADEVDKSVQSVQKDVSEGGEGEVQVTSAQEAAPSPAEAAAGATPPPAPTKPVDAAKSEPIPSPLEEIRSRNQLLQKSYTRSTLPLAPTIFDDCAQLCALLRAPVLWTGSGSPHGGAAGEAEALAASLVQHGQADAVATEDSDVILAEVPLLRHLTGSKHPMELIDTQLARRALFPPRTDDGAAKVSDAKPAKKKRGRQPKVASEEAPVKVTEVAADEGEPGRLPGDDDSDGSSSRTDASSRADAHSRYAMLEFALLCGTDYNRTIPRLGPKGALTLLRQHGTIRGILRKERPGKYSPPDGLGWKEYNAELSRARSVFRHPPDAAKALKLAGLRPNRGLALALQGEGGQDAEKDAGVPGVVGEEAEGAEDAKSGSEHDAPPETSPAPSPGARRPKSRRRRSSSSKADESSALTPGLTDAPTESSASASCSCSSSPPHLALPPAPRVPLLHLLRNRTSPPDEDAWRGHAHAHAHAGAEGPVPPDAHAHAYADADAEPTRTLTRQKFALHEYDAAAVWAFLRSKGWTPARERERRSAWQGHGHGGGGGGGGPTKVSAKSGLGFGQAFGGEVAGYRFGFEGEGAGAERGDGEGR